MSINEAVGNNIRNLRKTKNVTQEQLIEAIGDENLSLSTLKRIESGNGGFNVGRLSHICKALNCELIDLFDQEQTKAVIENYCRLIEDKGAVQYVADRQRLFYPKSSDHLLLRGLPITSLLQFIIYLPLMDEFWLYDCLQRIDGNGFDNDHYILGKLAFLYMMIPESDAKVYADEMARRCTYNNFMRYISSESTEEDDELLNPENMKRWTECGEAYSKIINDKFESLRRARKE